MATRVFVDLVQDEAAKAGASMRCIDISGDDLARGATHHVSRVARVSRALGAVATCRRGDSLYVSVDAGAGMIYTLALVTVARVRRVQTYLHHHSMAYLSRRSFVLATLCRIGASNTQHLVGCTRMARLMRDRYRGARQVRILPIEFAVTGADTSPPSRTRARNEVVLGHLGNLSEAKGLTLAFDTAALVDARGLPCRLLLAGPPATPSDEAALNQRMKERCAGVDYLGPVYGTERERFFDQTDVFLFPSRYRHESFGLVAGEALARGKAVVCFEAGCLQEDLLSGAGLVLQRNESFAERAATWVLEMWSDPQRWEAVAAGSARFRRRRGEASAQARLVARCIVRRQQPLNLGLAG